MNNTILPTIEEVKKNPEQALLSILPIYVELERLHEIGEVDMVAIADKVVEKHPEYAKVFDPTGTIEPDENMMKRGDEFSEPHM